MIELFKKYHGTLWQMFYKDLEEIVLNHVLIATSEAERWKTV